MVAGGGICCAQSVESVMLLHAAPPPCKQKNRQESSVIPAFASSSPSLLLDGDCRVPEAPPCAHGPAQKRRAMSKHLLNARRHD